jgi:hypothetical protein
MADKSGNAVYTFSFPEAFETFEPVTAPPFDTSAAVGNNN